MANRLINQRFELLRRLSSDERATQYYAWDRADPRSLLVIETKVPDDSVRRLQTVGGWATLSHPNIHRLYHALQSAEGSVLLVCEYLDALDVDTVLERLEESGQRLSSPVALAIGRAVLLGLAEAHAHVVGRPPDGRTLTHGDIGGHSVLLTGTGQVKLTGFGLQPSGPGSPSQDTESRDISATGEFLARLLSTPPSTRGILTNVPDDYRDLVGRTTQPAMLRAAISAASLAEDIRRCPACPTDNQATDLIARLVTATQTEDEAEEQRRVQYLRGGSASQYREVFAPEIPPAPVARRANTPASTPGTAGSALPDAAFAATDAKKRRGSVGWMIGAVLLAIAAVIVWRAGLLPPIASTLMSPFRSAVGSSGPELVTTPSGAEVMIGGEVVGETPYELTDLAPGPLSIRLFYPGFRPIDTVLIVKDPNEIRVIEPFVFEKRIRFSSIPGGATVYVDGRELSDRETSDYWVTAVDTITVEYQLHNQEPLAPARISPLAGLIEPTDTTIWTWIPDREVHGGELLGQFERLIRIRSIPDGASVFVNQDTIPIGETEVAFPAAYGRHRLKLKKAPFLDYAFEINVGRDSPSLYSVALQRTVHIRVASAESPASELAARIDWIRHGDHYIKTPADALTTPYSLLLDGNVHEVHLSREGFADTTVLVGPFTQSVDIVLERRPSAYDQNRAVGETGEERGWVRFVVKGHEGPIAGAEVIGVEKGSGMTLRYGLTNAAGEFVTYVPVGDYDWRAAKPGFEGRDNGEGIKPGRNVKTITLRLNDRGR